MYGFELIDDIDCFCVDRQIRYRVYRRFPGGGEKFGHGIETGYVHRYGGDRYISAGRGDRGDGDTKDAGRLIVDFAVDAVSLDGFLAAVIFIDLIKSEPQCPIEKFRCQIL